MNIVHDWFPVMKESELGKVPVPAQLWGTPVVAFKDSKDKVHVFEDRCPHRGAPLSKGKIVDDAIVCPYHGWAFGNKGECVSVPGLKNFKTKRCHSVKALSTVVRYGLVWASFGDKGQIPDVAELELSSYDQFSFESTANVGLFETVENALDPMHTHFVHGGWIRSNQQRQAVLVELKVEENSVEAICKNESKQSGVIHKLLSLGRVVTLSAGRFISPQLFQLEYRTSKDDHLLINGFLQPVNEHCSKVFLVCAYRSTLSGFLMKRIAKSLLKVAVKQDREMLNTLGSHLEQFEKPIKPVSTQADVVGPYVQKLLQGKNLLPKQMEIILYV